MRLLIFVILIFFKLNDLIAGDAPRPLTTDEMKLLIERSNKEKKYEIGKNQNMIKRAYAEKITAQGEERKTILKKRDEYIKELENRNKEINANKDILFARPYLIDHLEIKEGEVGSLKPDSIQTNLIKHIIDGKSVVVQVARHGGGGTFSGFDLSALARQFPRASSDSPPELKDRRFVLVENIDTKSLKEGDNCELKGPFICTGTDNINNDKVYVVRLLDLQQFDKLKNK